MTVTLEPRDQGGGRGAAAGDGGGAGLTPAWEVERARGYLGDCREVMRSLPAGSVQTIVTSPPYWGLRAYPGDQERVWGGRADCDHEWGAEERGRRKDLLPREESSAESRMGKDDRQGSGPPSGGRFCALCGAWFGALGLEPTVGDYICHMLEIAREMWRVLRDDGTLWLNIGDSYSTHGGKSEKGGQFGKPIKEGFDDVFRRDRRAGGALADVPEKNLMMVPARLALALQDAGWVIRSDIAWCKAASMPEPVRDRPTRGWEHVFLLVKRRFYFYDAEAVRRPHAEKTFNVHTTPRKGTGRESAGERFNKWLEDSGTGRILNPAGANLRDWWLLGPEPLADEHYAAFPSEIARRAILAGTSECGACEACGAPWRRVTEAGDAVSARGSSRKKLATQDRHGPLSTFKTGMYRPRVSAGWAPACDHLEASVRPCRVLDPFMGSGTSLLVANQLGREGIGIDTSERYVEMARRRLERNAPLLARLAEMEREPAAVAACEGRLF